ncbi:hypothetical protein [Lichenicoccus sp.]|uniref:hypothetical protein n=1 Tax=Lichenicoccus sp. TaxID=2781899 RepID=UPI003D0A1485
MSYADLLDHLHEDVAAPHHLRDDHGSEFRRCFNQRSFLFEHDLDREPLLSLPSLAALAARLEPQGSYYWSKDAAAIGDGWDAGRAARCGLAEAVATIERQNSLIMLKNAIDDPLFGPLFHGIVEQIHALCGIAMRDDVVVARATILIASPGRWTPYHADADSNFLMQIAGDKTFGVFSHTDRTLVTHGEIERLLCGDLNGVCYKPDRRHDAAVHDLRPGHGIHVPTFAPHWARNGSDVSIALSLNFDLKSIGRLASVCRVNRHMRRLGLRPAAPGLHPWRDEAKALAASMRPGRLLRQPRGR